MTNDQDQPSAGAVSAAVFCSAGGLSEALVDVIEVARHELTTLNGLLASDAAAPSETWQIDTTEIIKRLDAVIESF